MWFSQENEYIFYIKSNAVELWSKKEKNFTLLFPNSVVKHMEINDQKQFETLLLDAIKPLQPHKKKTYIVLDKTVVFEKKIESEDVDFRNSEMAHFFETVPFEENHIAKVGTATKSTLHLYATNQALLETINFVISKTGCILKCALPLSVFDIDTITSVGDISYILKKMKKYCTTYNMLDIEKKDMYYSSQSGAEGEEANRNRNPIVVLAVFLIVLGLSFFVFILNRKKTTPTVLTPTTTSSISGEKSKVETTNKEEPISSSAAKVEVLNGSGITGQAGKIKGLLEEKGFKDIETGNSEETYETTTVFYGAKVGSDMKKELESLLQDEFKSVESKTASSSSQYDITIITGKK